MSEKKKNGKGGASRGFSKYDASFNLARLLTRLPFISRLHPWLREDLSDIRWLPINQDIVMPANAPLPVELVERFIEEASHRVIAGYCGCRAGFGCENYPHDIGCLVMGDSALEIERFGCHEVGVDEAKAHLRRAVEAGLVPVVGKARVDNYIFDIPDRHRLLTVCLCCECCCVTRFTGAIPLKHLEGIFPHLDGISVRVTGDCNGCGRCVERCFIKAIEVRDKRAVIGDYCRACGRCAVTCPRKAIEVRIDDPDFLEKAYQRIRTYVDYE